MLLYRLAYLMIEGGNYFPERFDSHKIVEELGNAR